MPGVDGNSTRFGRKKQRPELKCFDCGEPKKVSELENERRDGMPVTVCRGGCE